MGVGHILASHFIDPDKPVCVYRSLETCHSDHLYSTLLISLEKGQGSIRRRHLIEQ